MKATFPAPATGKVIRLFKRLPVEPLLLALAAGLIVGWCAVALRFPFGWDQGIIASVGDVIVHGGLPYRDGWDSKGPLAYYLYAALEWILGPHMWSIRVFDEVLLLAAAAAFAWMMSRITSISVGLWASVALALWYASLTWFHVSQPDGWVALLLVLAMAPLIVQGDRVSALAICSLLIGCCALIKPFFAAFVLVPIVFTLTSGHTLSRKIRMVAFLGLISSGPIILAVAWFAYRGGLASLIEVHVLYNSRAYSATSLPPLTIARGVLDYLWTGGPRLPSGKVAVILPAIAFGAYALWLRSKQLGVTVVTWLLVALFCVAIQGKLFVYHWIPVFPPLVVLGAFGLWTLANNSTDQARLGRIFAVFAAAAFLTEVAVTPAEDVTRELLFLTGLRSRTEYSAGYARGPYAAGKVTEAASYIRTHTRESDNVAVFGNEAAINFLSGRQSPTRFVFGMPMTHPGLFRSDYRHEYMNGLEGHQPAYIVVGLPHETRDKNRTLSDFPELTDFLKNHYVLERQIGFLDLYHHIQ